MRQFDAVMNQELKSCRGEVDKNRRIALDISHFSPNTKNILQIITSFNFSHIYLKNKEKYENNLNEITQKTELIS